MEAVLAGDEALVLCLALALHRGHHGLQLADQLGHHLRHGLDGLAGDAGAVGQAVLQRAVDRCGQPAVGGFGLLVEAVLAGDEAVVLRLGLALHRGHHGLQLADQFGHHLRHGLDGFAGDAGAVGQAVFERAVDRGGEPRVGGFGLLVEGVLAGDEAFVDRLALAVHRGHHGLQLVDQRGHRVRLLLHELERLFAAMRQRMAAQ
ncbi:hypothetical protein D9M68_554670 [compost metagenome]